MLFNYRTCLMICGLIGLLAFPCSAQMGTGEVDKILNGMPPDLWANVQALAQHRRQGIKEGKLSEAEV